jgi:transposase
MSKLYRPWNPGQTSLFPASPADWLPKDHLVYFLLDVVSELNLSAIFDKDAECKPGRAAYSPRMMTALLLYAYCVGVPSSRKIEKRTYEDVAFRVLTADQHPDHTRISEFRRVHLEALSGLFLQVLKLCQRAGLVRLGHVALDGSKFKANASKRKAMSYKRMQKEEERLQKLVEDLFAKAEAEDNEEDTRYGRNQRGDELPEELQRAETRLKKIRLYSRICG